MTGAAARRPLSIYLVAAEESGDALGAALATSLIRQTNGKVQLGGLGGRLMAAAGIAGAFPIEELSIMGFAAIPRRLPNILRRIRETADTVVASRPDALVIIDSPDFTHRVARRVRREAPAIPIVDYVSPTVWVWRPGRARAMRAYVETVLAILPFEPAAHLRLGGPPCLYVGHPLIERIDELRPNAEEARRRAADPPLVLVLPGSRSGEIRRHLAIFEKAIELLAARSGPIELVLPTVPHLFSHIREATSTWSVTPRVVVEPADHRAAFRNARTALAASGTVTLELGLAGVPTVAAYRVPLFEELVLRLMAVRERPHSVILANLVLGENVVPEFLQRDCTPEKLAAALDLLIGETPQRHRQIEAFKRLDLIMSAGAATPSSKAAAIVLDIAQRGRRDIAGVKAVAAGSS